MVDKNKRRYFTLEEKVKMLEEAEASSYSAVGKKYSIGTNMLFAWRKQLNGHNDQDLLMANGTVGLREQIKKIEKLGKQIDHVSIKMLSDLESDKVSVYNAAIGLGSLMNAFGKLTALRYDTESRLISAIAMDEARNTRQDDEYDEEMARMAERCVRRLVEKHILPNQTEYVDKNGQVIKVAGA